MDDGADILARTLAAGPQLEANDWTLSDPGLALVLARLAAGAGVVAECGSGRSTVVIARHLRDRGFGSLHSLEHDPAWARSTRTRLEAEGLTDFARVIDAPLAAHPVSPPGCGWYERAALRALPDAGIELLLVDGPPAGDPRVERSRYPALPVLWPRLAPHAAVILDDAGRPGERWVLGRWESELPVAFDRRREDGVAIGVCCSDGRMAQIDTRTER